MTSVLSDGAKKFPYFHFVYVSLDSNFLHVGLETIYSIHLSQYLLFLLSSILPSHVSSPPPLGSTSALWSHGRYCPDWSFSCLLGSGRGLGWALGGKVCCPRTCPFGDLSCLSCVAFGHSRMIRSALVCIMSCVIWCLAGACLSFLICNMGDRILSEGTANSGDEPSVSECSTDTGLWGAVHTQCLLPPIFCHVLQVRPWNSFRTASTSSTEVCMLWFTETLMRPCILKRPGLEQSGTMWSFGNIV